MKFEESVKRFRAFDPINKKMAFVGFDILGETTMFDLCKQYELAHNVKLKITQFTGLKDHKGVEIYEGDILGFISENLGAYIVKFENGIFGLHGKFGYWGTIQKYFEVVKDYDISANVQGNIFENPTLFDSEPKGHNFF